MDLTRVGQDKPTVQLPTKSNPKVGQLTAQLVCVCVKIVV